MKFLVIAISIFIILGCKPEVENLSNSTATGIDSFTYPSKSIPVCFENYSEEDKSYKLVREELSNYSKAEFIKAGINLTGWGDCDSYASAGGNKQIRPILNLCY